VTQPLFHPATSQILAHTKNDLPQSLLLSGPDGIGLSTAARWLADDTIVEHVVPRDAKGNLSNSGTIGVESIRNLYEQTRSRTTNRQIIIISNADRMSTAASGAFLKLLEEPGHSIHFLLTSHQPHRLLPTIRSRLQHVDLKPLAKEQTAEFIDSHAISDATKRRQIEFIAGGLPAAIVRLIQDEAYFTEQAKLISDARDFLKGNRYEKLLIVHTYRQDRSHTLRLCDAILTLLRRALTAQPQPALIVQIERLLDVREKVAANGNAMLHMAQFVI
jgi:hypothetical protein